MAETPRPAVCGTFPQTVSTIPPHVIIIMVITLAVFPVAAAVAGLDPVTLMLLAASLAATVQSILVRSRPRLLTQKS